MDGPVLVHRPVDVVKERLGEELPDCAVLGLDTSPEVSPSGVNRCCRRVTETVAEVTGIECRVYKKDARRQGMGEIFSVGIEDPFPIACEATKCNT